MSDADRIKSALKSFLVAQGKRKSDFTDRTHLFFDLGLKSEQGVYFVLDLCDVFDFEFPLEFNPFVNKDETKIVRVGEMVSRIQQVLAKQEQLSGKR